MRKKKQHQLKCPCCGTDMRDVLMKRSIPKKLNFWGSTIELKPEDLKLRNYQWACDLCLQSRKAILANPNQQLYCDYPPYLAYFDQNKQCENCGETYVFKKEEQLYWYENLKFWVQSKPKNCLSCRKKLRLEKNINNELSTLLKDKQQLSIQDIERLISIYTRLNKSEKAKYYEKLLQKIKKLK